MVEMRLPIALAIIVMVGTLIYCDRARDACKEKNGVIVQGLFSFECVEVKP